MPTDSAQGRTEPTGVVARVGGQVRQFICGLHGHDALLHFGDGRVSLLCSSCGYETPGWDVKGAHVARRQTATPEARVVSMPLVSERRVA